MRYPLIQLAVAAAVLVAPMAVLAHEADKHSAAAGPVRKEQKPWGIAGDAKAVRRTIAITMSDDMRFSPSRLEVREGETVKFVVGNAGKLMHEIVIGTRKELDEHAALMVKFPGMEHDEPYMAHVAPAKKGELVWNFNRPGTFDYACLIAGHYQAGMVGKIIVTPRSKEQTQ